LKYLVFFWMAASKGGHDHGIGENIRVIKSQVETCYSVLLLVRF